jgi:hypothetical protein
MGAAFPKWTYVYCFLDTRIDCVVRSMSIPFNGRAQPEQGVQTGKLNRPRVRSDPDLIPWRSGASRELWLFQRPAGERTDENDAPSWWDFAEEVE